MENTSETYGSLFRRQQQAEMSAREPNTATFPFTSVRADDPSWVQMPNPNNATTRAVRELREFVEGYCKTHTTCRLLSMDYLHGLLVALMSSQEAADYFWAKVAYFMKTAMPLLTEDKVRFILNADNPTPFSARILLDAVVPAKQLDPTQGLFEINRDDKETWTNMTHLFSFAFDLEAVGNNCFIRVVEPSMENAFPRHQKSLGEMLAEGTRMALIDDPDDGWAIWMDGQFVLLQHYATKDGEKLLHLEDRLEFLRDTIAYVLSGWEKNFLQPSMAKLCGKDVVAARMSELKENEKEEPKVTTRYFDTVQRTPEHGWTYYDGQGVRLSFDQLTDGKIKDLIDNAEKHNLSDGAVDYLQSVLEMRGRRKHRPQPDRSRGETELSETGTAMKLAGKMQETPIEVVNAILDAPSSVTVANTAIIVGQDKADVKVANTGEGSTCGTDVEVASTAAISQKILQDELSQPPAPEEPSQVGVKLPDVDAPTALIWKDVELPNGTAVRIKGNDDAEALVQLGILVYQNQSSTIEAFAEAASGSSTYLRERVLIKRPGDENFRRIDSLRDRKKSGQ